MNKNFALKHKSVIIHIVLFISLIGAFLLVYHSMFTSTEKKDIWVIFRYDDFSSESSSFIEKEILLAVDNYHISCSFGVIPFAVDSFGEQVSGVLPLNENKIALIRSYVNVGTIEICQHGYLHQTITSSEPNSEFKGLSYTDQTRIIRDGKRYLDSAFKVNIATFIPPWNTYDHNTLQSLSDLGFTNLSADNLGIAEKTMPLNYVPFTTTLSELKHYINFRFLPFHRDKAYMVVMLHDYDFIEIDKIHGTMNIHDFRNIIQKIVENNWRVESIDEAMKNNDYFNHHHFRINRFKMLLLDHLSFLSNREEIFKKSNLLNIFYLSDYQLFKILFLVLIYYLFIALLVTELVAFIIQKIRLKSSMVLALEITGILVFIAMIFYSWFDDSIFGKNELHLIIGNLGIILGLLRYYTWKISGKKKAAGL
jgi:hypothetical protein